MNGRCGLHQGPSTFGHPDDDDDDDEDDYDSDDVPEEGGPGASAATLPPLGRLWSTRSILTGTRRFTASMAAVAACSSAAAATVAALEEALAAPTATCQACQPSGVPAQSEQRRSRRRAAKRPVERSRASLSGLGACQNGMQVTLRVSALQVILSCGRGRRAAAGSAV